MMLGLSADNGLLILLGVFCLVTVSTALLRWSQQRTTSLRDVTRAQRAELREEQELRGTLEDMLAQLDELSRRMDAQVDARVGRLEQALRAADARIAELRALTESRPVVRRAAGRAELPQDALDAAPPGNRRASAGLAGTQDAKAGTPVAKVDVPGVAGAPRGGAPANVPSAAAPVPAAPPAKVLAPPVVPPSLLVQRSAAAPPATNPSVPAAPRAETPRVAGMASAAVVERRLPLPVEERKRRVYELADASAAAMTIADTLQIPLGEVELILSLRQFR
jgi:hypothetical protein